MAANQPFLQRAIELVRKFAMDTADQNAWSDAQIVELVDSANGLVFEEILASTEPKSYNRYSEATISVVAGTDEYEWPGNVRKLLRFVRRDASTLRILEELFPAAMLSDIPGLILLDEQRGFRIFPMPRITQDWTLIYESGVTPYLAYGTASAGGSTSITFPSSPTAGTIAADANFYVNSYVRICSGTGAGQERRITAYNGSTRVATVSKAWGTNPDNTSVFEIMPCLKHPWDKAIMWRAAMMLKASDSDRMHRAAAQDEFNDAMRPVLMKAAARQGRLGPSMNSEFMEAFDYGET